MMDLAQQAMEMSASGELTPHQKVETNKRRVSVYHFDEINDGEDEELF